MPAVDPADPYLLWNADVEKLLDALPKKPIFDLIVTSPPYNIGKPYEKKKQMPLDDYIAWQQRIIEKLLPLLKDYGSLCWQVGNYVENGEIAPLDLYLHPIFAENDLHLRNRIIWRFGHGMHCKRRFSGRYETVMWYTKGEDYVFNLDAVRINSKYPGKRHFRGPKKGKLSGNPLGKNPEDVWDIPNVKSKHVEKTSHPCQFPVALIERLVLSMTNKGGLVFDPFAGVASAGVAAAIHGRRFWGAEIEADYIPIGIQRIEDALAGKARHRPHTKPILDHTTQKLAQVPPEFTAIRELRAREKT